MVEIILKNKNLANKNVSIDLNYFSVFYQILF